MSTNAKRFLMASSGGGASYFLTLLTRSGGNLLSPLNDGSRDWIGIHPDDSSIALCMRDGTAWTNTNGEGYIVNLAADGATLNWQSFLDTGSPNQYTIHPWAIVWNSYESQWQWAGMYRSNYASNYYACDFGTVSNTGSITLRDSFYRTSPYRGASGQFASGGMVVMRYDEGSGTKTNLLAYGGYTNPGVRSYPSWCLWTDPNPSFSRYLKYDNTGDDLYGENRDRVTNIYGSDSFISSFSVSVAGNPRPQIVQYSRSAGSGNFDDDWVTGEYPNAFTHYTKGPAMNADYSSTTVYHCGQFQAIVGGSRQAGLTKWTGTDSTPSISWARYVGGGTNSTDCIGVDVDSSGNAYIMWYDNSTYSNSFLITKYNDSGTLQWTRRFQHGANPGTGYHGRPSSIHIDDNTDAPALLFGNYGTDTTYSANYYTFIFRYPTDGSVTGTYGPYTITSVTAAQSGSWTPSTASASVSESNVTTVTENTGDFGTTTDVSVNNTFSL